MASGAARPYLDRAEAALANDDLSGARGAFLEILQFDPNCTIARRGVAEIDREVLANARARGLTRQSVLRLVAPAESVLQETPSEAVAAALAPLLAGETVTVEQLSRGSLPLIAVLEVVGHLLDREQLALDP